MDGVRLRPPVCLTGYSAVLLRTVDDYYAVSGHIKVALVGTALDSTSMPVVLVYGRPGASQIVLLTGR